MPLPDDTWGLSQFLAAIGAATPSPAGGSAAAAVGAVAAALCEMTASISHAVLPDSTALASQARRLSQVLAELAEEDATAFDELLAARRALRTDPGAPAEALAAAEEKIADIPLQTARAALRVARLASDLAAQGLGSVQGDNVAAALLAECSGRIAGTLLRINLSGRPGDDRLLELEGLEADLAAARARAEAALGARGSPAVS